MTKHVTVLILKSVLPLLFLLIFASVNFFLILRHKSPYTSDSNFYRHMMYEMEGNDFSTAYNKVLSKIDLSKTDKIEQNFYQNKEAYQNSLSFFKKRPLYPFIAYLLNNFLKNEYLSFLLPVYIAYFGTIWFAYRIIQLGLNKFYTSFTIALFISFYPFLDLSTYFLTDTIGSFFWLWKLSIIYNYFLIKKSFASIFYYSLILIISLLNREQGLLFSILLSIILVFFWFKRNKHEIKQSLIIWMINFLIVIIYFIIQGSLGQKNLLDTIKYTQNNYGLYSQTFTSYETFIFLSQSIVKSHQIFFQDLLRSRWWFAFLIFAFLGVSQRFRNFRKWKVINLLMLSSIVSSYSAIFFYPVLSYRYFYPVVLGVIYFAVIFIQDFFRERPFMT